MADELNVPTHRWYEPRNNIALPPNAVSAKYILANGVALIDAWINSRPWGPYSVDGFVPPLALDFVADYYQTDSTATTFDSALTFTRASSATMVDSTGAIVTVASGVPRRGHHVYNGSEWVNEGLLVESEARTNLFLNSGTLSTQSVTVTAVPHTLSFTGTGTVTLTGVSTAGPLVGTGTGENNRVSLTFTPTAGVLLATVTGTVTNAQLEAGSTPSSYIPTAGATVTRAAETLVIPSANLPWPSPQYVTGTELVTNGTFDTDTTWTKGAGVTISGGALNFSGVVGGVGAAQPVVLPAGVYLVSVELKSWTSGGLLTRVRTAGGTIYGAVSIGYTSPSLKVYSAVISVPSSANLVEVISPGGAGSPTNATLDNISVKEINPLSVSIAMDGRMTYADIGSYNTVNLVRWILNSGNLIETKLDTFNGTGDAYFVQGAYSVFDNVTDVSVYSPNALVPFNIASRHGSTFINGAVDGVALTANLTPVALPDLSASNLQLGYAFMGVISKFRVWSDDLGDAGIAEAST